MKTSKEWWNETKGDNELLIAWLKKQYHGEAVAAERIAIIFNKLEERTEEDAATIELIIEQESRHAKWIAGLLNSRNQHAKQIDDHNERYWQNVLGDIKTVKQFAAVAAHAEEMRLERIKVIAADEDAPSDIRDVFSKILVDELFHARAFRAMTDDESYESAKDNHAEGCEAIGLVV